MQISVVVPLYNKKEGILKALNSVFQQTFQPSEIIVINDGSTDGSEKLVEELQHPLIRLIHQANAGVSAARNKGIKEAKGDWIAFLDADDEWKPEYLENIKLLHNIFSNANVLGTAYQLQDFKGDIKSIILNKLPFVEKQGILSNYFQVAAFSHPPLWTSAIVVKKDALREIGCFPLGIKSGEDLLTWAKLAVCNDIAYSLMPLSVFKQDAAHTYDDKPNRIPENPDIVGVELIKLYNANKKIIGLKDYVAHWFKMRASVYLRLGETKNVFINTYKSILYSPLSPKLYIYILMAFMPLSIRNRLFKTYSEK